MQLTLILLLGVFSQIKLGWAGEGMPQCFCADNYTASGDKCSCLPFQVNLGGACELSAQCQQSDTYAVCDESQKRCVCMENFEQHQGKCLGLLDLSCSNKTQCEHMGASICLPQGMKCACIPGYVPNHDRTTCITGVGLGGQCTSAEPCQLQLGAGSICTDNRCSCRSDHIPKMKPNHTSPVCEPRVPYGINFRITEDCLELDVEGRLHDSRMQCLKGVCQCRAEFRVMDNQYCVAAPSAANPLYKKRSLLLLIIFLFFIWQRLLAGLFCTLPF